MKPALANTPLDLQIEICKFLHPSDILTLRKTCKAFEPATRKRIVWVAALHRVCLDNTLFLPSFPIPDMSDLELERAAMAPHRWIELCGASQKQNSIEYSTVLHPRTTRILKCKADIDKSQFFIVPGGRYLLTVIDLQLLVWDLGYASTVDCKLVASAMMGLLFESFMVQATPDGKGLVILSYHRDYLSIFEIYPQSEISQLTEIARFDLPADDAEPAHLLPDTLICRGFYEDRTVFRVVDYRTNYSTCFSADVIVEVVLETFATRTAIIVLCREEILIWAIPPLSPQPSDHDHFLNNNPTHLPPLFKIPLVPHTHEIFKGMTLSSWYFGSSESVYFDILYQDSKLQRFKIIIKPDLSDAFLHVINMSEFISVDIMTPSEDHEYRICEDALVYAWNNHSEMGDFWNGRHRWGAYTELTTAPFTSVVTQCGGYVLSFCPASGRFVYSANDGDGVVVVVDLF